MKDRYHPFARATAGLLLSFVAVPLSGNEGTADDGETIERQKAEVESVAAREFLQSLGETNLTHENLAATVNEFLRRRDSRLIVYREATFDEAASYAERLHYAVHLVYLGADDPMYWAWVYGEARNAIESGMPNSSDPAARPGMAASELPEFRVWREDRNLSLAEALELQNRYFVAVRMLGGTLDRRAVGLLLEGLRAENALILRGVLKSLARLQDPRTVGPIVEAVTAQPLSVGEALADILLYFDDGRAQELAEKLIGDPVRYGKLKAHFAEHGVETIYGY